MKRHTAILLGLVGFAAGCGVLGDNVEASSEDIVETDGLFGDDRVSDVLKGHLDKVPSTYAEAEKLFGVGRACARPESDKTKEVYVVEEEQTRANGQVTQTKDLLPRAVVSGCNTPEHRMKETTDPESGSFSLFIALFSDPGMPNAEKGDAIVFDRVETMALDRRTGLYNFYVFTPGPKKDGPGVMQRIRLMPNNDVMVWTMEPGAPDVVKEKSAGRECNDCHVNMGPLMNEMHEPWTNWVSSRKVLPASAKGLSGETKSIVDEASSVDGSHPRQSFANALEKTMQAGIKVWVEGLSSVPGSGFARANLDGDQPQGVSGLLKSVFCETELQYKSVFDVVPLELFADPGAVDGAQMRDPEASANFRFPILFPVRSDMDKRIETGLLKLEVGPDSAKKKLLSKQTTVAIRLFDEGNDVFSKKRCGLYPKVLEQLPKDAAKVEAHIRKVLNEEIKTIPEGVTREYAKALLTDGADATAARTAYFEDARARLAKNVEKLVTPAGQTELKKRSQARKDGAAGVFAGPPDRKPMPALPDEAL